MKLTRAERKKLAQRSWTIPEFTSEAAFYGSILFVIGVVATLVGIKLSLPVAE